MRRTQALFVTMGLLAAGCTTAPVSEDSITTTTSSDTTQSLETTTVAPTTTTEPTTTTTETVVLDFSQIAGTWSGTGVDAFEEFSIEAEIQPSAELNSAVANVTYVGTLSISQEPCHRVWRAQVAEPPVYELREIVRSGPCPAGTVTLEYDAETDTIAYQYRPPEGEVANPASFVATGTLHRAEP